MQIKMVFEKGEVFVPAIFSTTDLNRTEVTIPRSVLETHVRDNGLPVFDEMPALLGRRTSGWHYLNSDAEVTDKFLPGHTLHFTLHEEVAAGVIRRKAKTENKTEGKGVSDGKGKN